MMNMLWKALILSALLVQPLSLAYGQSAKSDVESLKAEINRLKAVNAELNEENLGLYKAMLSTESEKLSSLSQNETAIAEMRKVARETSKANGCINNMRQIEAAKDQYALENGLTNGATVTFANLVATSNIGGGYLKTYPVCPASANYANCFATKTTTTMEMSINDYTINPIGVNVACKHFHDATPPHELK